VEEEEWPAMARQQQANLTRSPGVLTEAIVMLLEFTSTRTGEQVAQERAVAALEARRNRIMLSGVLIDWLQWWVVVLLIVLVLVMIAMSHIDNRGVALFLCSSSPPLWPPASSCSWPTISPSMPAVSSCGRRC